MTLTQAETDPADSAGGERRRLCGRAVQCPEAVRKPPAVRRARWAGTGPARSEVTSTTSPPTWRISDTGEIEAEYKLGSRETMVTLTGKLSVVELLNEALT